MTTTSTASGSMDTAGGAITRLNPADGLFLRAEHLRAMEDYASDLALAVGMAGGPGVVHGETKKPDVSEFLAVHGLFQGI